MSTLSRTEQRKASARKGQLRAVAGRKCRACGRGNALGARVEWPGEGHVRQCRYCGHEQGILYGKPFGFVSPAEGEGR